MKNLKHILKNNIKFALGFIIGTVLASTSVYAATYLFTSNEVSYDNSSSGLTSTDVKGALDELYEKNLACSKKTVYTVSSTKAKINEVMPTGIVQYQTADEARANFSNAQTYLKHEILNSNNTITASYIEFIITDQFVQYYPEATTGTYSLKGGDGGASYDSNKEVLKKAFGSSYSLGDYHSATGLSINIKSSGEINITVNYQYGSSGRDPLIPDGSAYKCNISSDGQSYCESGELWQL